MKKVNIYFFSGTGNTAFLAKKFKEILNKKGVECVLFKIEDLKYRNVDVNSDLIMFLFPVAVGLTYPFILENLKRLNGMGKKVAVVPNMAAKSLGLKSIMKNILIKSNFDPYFYKELIMPGNYLSIKSEEENKNIINKTERKIDEILDELLVSRSWGSSLFHYFLVLPLFYLAFFSFRKKINLNKEKCVQCGLCETLCPVSNIKVIDYPEFEEKCEMCLRCTSFCPKKALYIKEKNEKHYALGELKDLDI
jgi:NAD-dependent dihydropyrimidine dehydrogenase PreA subunit/cellobiose-specific phosphotransferase system component IIB